MTTARLLPVLERLRAALVPLVDALDGAVGGPEIFDGRLFDPEQQWRFTLQLLELLGFDLGAGRQDRSVHPFTGGTHPTDVRLTTRIDPRNPSPAVFGTLHEFGHGLYEQGFLREHHRTPLAASPSMGLHESQSRLWENLVGRSLPFWRFLYPRLKAAFPIVLAGVELDDFHRAINRVQRSPIRVEADEVTTTCTSCSAPRWRSGCSGTSWRWRTFPRPGTPRWSGRSGSGPATTWKGPPGHSLGPRRVRLLPDLRSGESVFSLADARRRAGAPHALGPGGPGEVGSLRAWLGEHIHRHGARGWAEERIQAVTGHGLTDMDFLAYLRAKYGALSGRTLPLS
jgi:carboxypeptidase Taq